MLHGRGGVVVVHVVLIKRNVVEAQEEVGGPQLDVRNLVLKQGLK